MFELNDVVVFKETHKWAGCIGFVNEIKKVKDKDENDTLMLIICVPVPQQEMLYIYATTDMIEKVEGKYPYRLEEKQ